MRKNWARVLSLGRGFWRLVVSPSRIMGQALHTRPTKQSRSRGSSPNGYSHILIPRFIST